MHLTWCVGRNEDCLCAQGMLMCSTLQYHSPHVQATCRFEDHSRVRVVGRDHRNLVSASTRESLSLLDCVFEVTPAFTYSITTARNNRHLVEALDNERDVREYSGKPVRYGQTVQLCVALRCGVVWCVVVARHCE